MIYDGPLHLIVGGDILHVELGDEISLSCSRKIHELFYGISGVEGVTEVTPAYSSLAIKVDLSHTTFNQVIEQVNRFWGMRGEMEFHGKEVKVPVCYEGQFAPDLDWVASRAGLAKSQVVEIHANKVYTCMMLGFSPGFVYLDEVDNRIASPRLETPRTKVVSGSIGIADAQTGIYGIDSPGGWRVIGRSAITTFNPRVNPPTPIAPGDYVKFEPISEKEFEFIKAKPREEPERVAGTCAFEVIQPGIFTTVQDRGRRYYRHLGVPRSGGLDVRSLVQANYILGNPANAPTLEIIGGHFKARALMDLIVAVTGADSPVTINGEPAEMWGLLLLSEGEEIVIGGPVSGFINYLGVAGGFGADLVMGSGSTFVRGNFGGFEGRVLRLGDMLRIAEIPEQVSEHGVPASERVHFITEGNDVIRVTPAVHVNMFSERTWKKFYEACFVVSEISDRMGYRLKTIDFDSSRLGGRGVLTYPTYPGYVQIPSGGSPIVLQQDCQTTGGYMAGVCVLPSQMGRLSQLAPGSKIVFEEVKAEESVEETREFFKSMDKYDILR